MSKKLNISEVLGLFKSEDELAVPLATGQPFSLLAALSDRTDWKDLHLFAGLLRFPYPILQNPAVSLTSGYYGPLERMLNEAGLKVNYLPANFNGFETLVRRRPFRVMATTLSPPDEEGYLSFGTHGAAVYKPFCEASASKDLVTIAEVNPTMPRVYGAPGSGDNKIHVSELQYYFEADSPQLEIPTIVPSEEEKKIADQVLSFITEGSTLQLGIGGIPNLVAEKLAQGPVGNFGIHSELVSDGFLKLFEAGKISNREKGIFQGQSVFTFALGTQALYDFLDERKSRNKRQAICLPVSAVNSPHIIAQNKKFVSVNSGLLVDFAGQVCSESIGYRQYSGVGGQLSFVEGAYDSLDGISILCIKSSAMVDGKRVSNIVASLPPGSIVSTPRHFVQYIVTEYGVANLYGVPDEKRGELLIPLAHPDFRDSLKASFEEIKKKFYF